MPEMPEPIWMPMRCARGQHVYPQAYALGRPHFQSLHAAYTGRRCGKNAEGLLVCPHKGFVLNSLPRDERGRVVCPLHGLVIDMETETVVSASVSATLPTGQGEVSSPSPSESADGGRR